MNKDLKDRSFNLPQNIINNITVAVNRTNGKSVRGLERAKKLLNDKKVTYGQLKRIIHDLSNMDKMEDFNKYNLAGGDDMLLWAKQYLKGERDLIKNKKKSKTRANNISGLDGERKNSFIKKHKKKLSYNPQVNFMKNNSDRNSISSLKPKLFEEVNKIKKLINY